MNTESEYSGTPVNHKDRNKPSCRRDEEGTLNNLEDMRGLDLDGVAEKGNATLNSHCVSLWRYEIKKTEIGD